MALSASALSTAMQAQIGLIAGINITNAAELKAFTDAISASIVTHITGNAVVVFASGISGTCPPGGGATDERRWLRRHGDVIPFGVCRTSS